MLSDSELAGRFGKKHLGIARAAMQSAASRGTSLSFRWTSSGAMRLGHADGHERGGRIELGR